MKQRLITLCSSFIILAGCEPTDRDAPQTARIKARAAMEQKVNEVVQQLRLDCDSNLLATARYRADSIYAAQKKKPTRRRRR